MGTKIDGIYVALRADYQQFKQDLSVAQAAVKSASTEISNSLNNALSPAQISRGTSALVRDLANIEKNVRASATSFNTAGITAKQLGVDLGISSKAFSDLQARMLKNQAAESTARALSDIGRQAGLSQKEIKALGKELGVAKDALDKLGSGGSGLGSLLGMAGGVALIGVAISKIIDLSRQASAIAMERESLTQAFANVSGSPSAGASNLGFIRTEAERLGLAFDSTAQSAKSFFAATRGTEIAGSATEIFSSMSEAISAMKLSEQDASRVFIALGQMASKGKVQAEELRQQLGEALPGAFQKMAKGMGVSTRELDKMLEDGRVGLDALVKMAIQFHQEFGGKAEEASRGMAGELSRLKTAWNDLLAGMADTEAAARNIRHLTGLVKGLSEATKPKTMDQKIAAAEADYADKKSRVGQVETIEGNSIIGVTDWDLEMARARLVHLKELKAEAEEELKDQSLMDAYRAASERDEAYRVKAIGNARTYAKSLPTEQLKAAKQEYDQVQSDLRSARERGLIDDAEYLARSGQVGEAYGQKIESIQKQANAAAEKVAEAMAKVRKEFTSLFGTEQEKRAAEWAEMYRDILKSGLSPDNPELRRLSQAMQLRIKYTMTPDQVTTLSSIKDGWQTRDEGMKDANKRAEKLFEEDLKLQTEFAEKHRAIVLDETEFKLEQITEQAKAYTRAGADSVAVEQWAAAERLKVSRDWKDGAVRGVRAYADEAMNASRGVEKAVTGAFRSMEDALVSFATTGKVSFTDFANSVISDMVRMAVQQSLTGPLASAASSGLGSWLSSLFGGGFNVGGATGSSTRTGGGFNMGGGEVSGLHSGGIAGLEATFTRSVDASLFAHARRYHSGGLAGDEVPAILRRGEGVFTREQMAALGGSGQPPVVNIVVQDQSGSVQSGQQTGAKWDGDKWVIGVVLKAARTNKGFRNAFNMGGM